MQTLKLLVMAAAVPWAFGCDLSQKRPETISPPLPATSSAFAGGTVSAHPPGARQFPADGTAGVIPNEGAAGQKSIRLFGKGVSRRLQTRV